MIFANPDLDLILPELVLLGGTLLMLMVDLFARQNGRWLTHALALLVLAATAGMVLAQGMTLTGTAWNGAYERDVLSAVLKLAICLVSALCLIYSRSYLADRNLWAGEFYLLVLFAVLGMSILVSAGNLIIIYLGLELMALSTYALVALHRDNRRASEAAVKYFVLGALASGMLLYGMSMIFGATGSLDISTIAATYGANETTNSLMAFGTAFIVVGLAFKLGAAPFHMWLPDVYQGAPTAVTTFIGSAPKLAAFGMAWRLLEGALGGLSESWTDMLSLLAVASLAIGNLAAIMQTNLKRMLAYSTISHVGFLLLGLIQGTPDGYAAALFYAICYALMSAGAFGVILWLARQGFEAEDIDDLKGLNQRAPWAAFVMLLFMASLAGIPPLVGFFGKLMVLKAVIEAGRLWLAIAAVVFAVIGAFYYLRVIKAMYFDKPEGADAMPAKDRGLSIALSANGLAQLGLGLYWGPLIAWCLRAFS
ncbi:NADH-quinone oxidoreductase subunit NuoN [Pseudofulvimonas gallinarii]|jgi:NADH-quinone oxidoreductase subunit N|uniref:NADH-quinone oxidoreductase subunit N n=1 Tax=Pseudofulvimonas gallinarii TaxID=634155 RepID=A0A4V6NZF5_9GAMM|nr:NADH-quinone oxidoreductase subunit NuoN [Pseudofulvimonas gallinarii]TCT01178.1 NADH dehydrogenase subunit N [Pseudofulvimonas gallinarii]THD14947.1 NADH-quinone oxidoreductase subunit N [Pseudofulvimonas gallinarii]